MYLKIRKEREKVAAPAVHRLDKSSVHLRIVVLRFAALARTAVGGGISSERREDLSRSEEPEEP